MPRLTHICLGMCSVSLIVLGLVTVPMGVSAAPGDPEGGPSGYSNGLLMYGNSDQNSNQQYAPQQYGSSQNSGSQQYGNSQNGGQQQYSSSQNSGQQQYNSSQNGGQQQYGSSQNSGQQQYGSSQYGGSQDGNSEYGSQEYGGSSCSSIHKIVAGENLSTIASDNGVSLDALVEANNIDDPNLIVEGQALCIPGGDSYGDSHEDSYSSQGGGYSGPVDPGQSYDPSAYNQGGNSGSQSQYGPQESSNNNYPSKSGESYNSSAYNNNSSAYNNNGGQPEQYGPQSYGTPEPSYSEPEYGSHEYDSHESESCVDMETYHGTPGKSYDPSYVAKSYPQCDPIVHITATPVATATPVDTTPPIDE